MNIYLKILTIQKERYEEINMERRNVKNLSIRCIIYRLLSLLPEMRI